jgi:hypothetical protein
MRYLRRIGDTTPILASHHGRDVDDELARLMREMDG